MNVSINHQLLHLSSLLQLEQRAHDLQVEAVGVSVPAARPQALVSVGSVSFAW